MRLLFLFALVAVVGWFAPQFAESTNAPCPALEQRIVELLKTEGSRLPAGLAADPRVAALLGAVQGAAKASGGLVAQTYAGNRYPQLPPDLACVAAWWKLKVDPDLGPGLANMMGR